MAEELEKKELKIDELIASKGRSFFLRADGIIHNGVNIESTEAINCIADGKIIAMRLSEDYKNIESINKDLEFDNNYLSYYHLSRKFSEEKENLIKIEKQDDSNKQNETNSNNELNNSDANNKKEEIFYFTKKISKDNKETYKFNNDLKDFDRIEGLYFLNEIISNNFILIEHDLTKNNGDQIKFYSLYNHLAPQGRMTYEQRLNLPWYEHKITLNTSKVKGIKTKDGEFIPCECKVKYLKYIDKNTIQIEYNNKIHYINSSYYDNTYGEIKEATLLIDPKEEDGVPVYTLAKSARTFKEKIDIQTEFEFDFDKIKTYKKDFKGRMPLLVRYGENKEGYIFLNENKKYDEKTWNDAINKFYSVINKDKDSVDFLNFQIKIPYKKDFSKGKIENAEIIYPENCTITSEKIIGYSGFNFMRKDTIADKDVIVQDTKQEDNKKIALTAPFTVHIETFFKDESEIKFNYKDESKWDPFYFKLSKEYKAFTKKPTTNCKSAENVLYNNALIELEKEVKFYSDEIFYKIKIIANVIKSNANQFIESNSKIIKWNGKRYVGEQNITVNTYNKNEIKQSTIKIEKDFLYNCEDGKTKSTSFKGLPFDNNMKMTAILKMEYYYEKVDEKEYYIKKSDFDKFKQEPGSNIYNQAIKEKHFFIKNKLDSTNLFLSIEKENMDDNNTETLTGSTEKPIKFEYQNKKFDEYNTLESIESSATWYKTKANASEYWIKSTDIIENGGNSIEVFSYNDWSKVLNILNLNEGKKPIFYIDGYKSLKNLTGKSLEEQKEKNTQNLKKALGLKKDTPENEHLINKIMSYKIIDTNFLFKHHNEWDNNDELQKVYKDLKNKITKEKYKKIIKEYSFMDQVKTKLDNKDSFFYANPYYFIKNLDKIITIPDFNPYEGKKIKVIHSGIKQAVIDKIPSHKGYTITVKTNPGFVPAINKNDTIPKGYETNAKERFPEEFVFNDWYCSTISWEYKCPWYYESTVNKKGEHIPHTGIDWFGHIGNSVSVPIVALVNSTIWAMTTAEGNYSDSYGRMMLIKDHKDRLYLLGHLENFNDINGKQHKVGDVIKPGDVVAWAGNTGNSFGHHLHLEMLECNTGMDEDSRKSVLNIAYNQLHENDGGAKGEKKALFRFATGKGTLWNLKDYGDWKSHRLNPITGER